MPKCIPSFAVPQVVCCLFHVEGLQKPGAHEDGAACIDLEEARNLFRSDRLLGGGWGFCLTDRAKTPTQWPDEDGWGRPWDQIRRASRKACCFIARSERPVEG